MQTSKQWSGLRRARNTSCATASLLGRRGRPMHTAWRGRHSCFHPSQPGLISKGQLHKPTPCWIRAHAGEAHRLVPWHLDDHCCAPRHHLGLAQRPGSGAPASGNATLATNRGNILRAAGENQSVRAPSATDDLPAGLRRVCRTPDPHGLTRV